MACSVAHADVLYINKKEEAATGSYRYPVDSQGKFTPGYFYVPSTDDVVFTLIAQDGATLHIFDDAAGTNELSVPASLQTDGQYQSSSDGSNFHQGTIHLTQGWHKLYVNYTLLSLRDDASDCYCRLNYSTGQLHSSLEAVSVTPSFDDWVGTTTRTKTGTITVTQADGVTLAAGDSLTYVVDKVTSDAAGQNPVDASRASIDGDATTDVNGVANVTITWQPHPDPCGTGPVIFFIWLRVADTSQPYMATPQPVTAQPSPVPTTNQTSLQAAQTDGPIAPQANPVFPILPIAIDCDPNGGGGGDPGGGGGGGGGPTPKRIPTEVVNIRRTEHVEYYHPGNPFVPGSPSVFGHHDAYTLMIRDQFHKPYENGYPIEQFLNVKKTDNAKLLKEANIKAAPGSPTAWNDKGSTFVDNNDCTITYDSGRPTFWFSFTQQWFCAVTEDVKLYKLNTHKVIHVQMETTRQAPGP